MTTHFFPPAPLVLDDLEAMQMQAIHYLATCGFLPQATALWSSVLRHVFPLVRLEQRQAQQHLIQQHAPLAKTGSHVGSPSPALAPPSLLTASSGGSGALRLEAVVVPMPGAERGRGAVSNDKVFSLFPYGLFYSFDYVSTPGGGDESRTAEGRCRRVGAAAAYNLALSYHLRAIEAASVCPRYAGSSSSCASLLGTVLNAYKTARDLLESVHMDDPDRHDYLGWTDEEDRLLLLAITNNEGHAQEILHEPLSLVAESLSRLHTILEASSVAYYRNLLSATASDDRSSSFELWDLYGSFFFTSGLYPPSEGTPSIHSPAA